MSERFLSGKGSVLSFHRHCDPLFCPGQPQAHRVRCHVEHDGDLTRFQLLPCPQANELLVRFVQFTDSRRETDVTAFTRRIVESTDVEAGGLGEEPADEPQSAMLAPTVVGEAPLGDTVRPGEWVVDGHAVESAPDHEQCLVEQVGYVFGSGAPAEVALQRLVHHVDDRLELPAPIDVDVHDTLTFMACCAVPACDKIHR